MSARENVDLVTWKPRTYIKQCVYIIIYNDNGVRGRVLILICSLHNARTGELDSRVRTTNVYIAYGAGEYYIIYTYL